MDNPLITYGIKCYNQKEYMPSVLRAAFAQTYKPMEIIVVDDGSTDGSGEVILQLLDEYRKNGGVAFYERNEPNLGNVGTFERLARLAHGELLVQADGDDISTPDRVEKIVECWLSQDKEPYAIISGAYSIDLDNRVFGEMKATEFGIKLPIGAAMAWNPRVVTQFPPCINPRACDDGIMVVRAAYFAPIAYVDAPLVYHRVGSGVSTSLYDGEAAERKCVLLARQYYDQWNADLCYMKGRCAKSKFNEMARTVSELIEMWEAKAEKLDRNNRNDRNVYLQFRIMLASILHLIFSLLPSKVALKWKMRRAKKSYCQAILQWNKKVEI